MSKRIEAWSHSRNPLLKSLARIVRTLGHARRFLFNPRIRSEQLTRARFRDRQIQAATYTEFDRYPDLFAAAEHFLAPIESPAILSFGCSIGQEVFTLEQYLPNARILGVDINDWCLQQARAHNTNPHITFLNTLSPEFASAGPFDCIFCMAVLQRTEHQTAPHLVATSDFNFARFEESLALLDSLLKPNGLLFLDHTNFDFAQTRFAPHYQPLDFLENSAISHGPLFDSHNQPIPTPVPLNRAFRKLTPSPQAAT